MKKNKQNEGFLIFFLFVCFFGFSFANTLPNNVLDFWGSFPMESDSSHPQSRVLKILIRFPPKMPIRGMAG